MAVTTIAVISLVAGLVGAGVSAYGQYQAGKTQETIANYNAHLQERNAAAQLAAMQAQSNIMKQQAEAQYALRAAEAQARFNNAKSMENKVQSQDAIARENARKRSQQFAAAAATQRATIAASGVVEATGTPLDLIAETAATIQRDREEQAYTHELERRTLLREASMERLGGKLALAGATLDRSSALAEAGLRGAAGRMQYLAGMRESEITRLSGAAASKAGAINAAGTLLSGLSGAYGSYSQMSYQGAFRTA